MIKYSVCILLSILFSASVSAQSLSVKLNKALEKFSADEQLRHSTYSLCVLNGKTGKIIFSKNKDIGLAPASCLKTVTAAAALSLLGEDFRYATLLQYSGSIDKKGILHGDIIIKGSGDPTLGSWRYDSTPADKILHEWITAIHHAGIKKIDGNIIGDDAAFGTQTIPDGWIWQDIGNYYGAGGSALNWIENQFPIYLKPGNNIGDSASIVRIDSMPPQINFINELSTGAAGSGDQGYVYLPPYLHTAYLRGTVPLDAEKNFSISGAVPDPGLFCAYQLQNMLLQSDINITGNYITTRLMQHEISRSNLTTINTHYSPALDSIIYWFLKRSINLYGELLVKKMAQQAGLTASTDNGVAVIHQYCAEKGIDTTAVNTIDGSGLSPGNRITTYAMAKMLSYDQQEKWFPAFYNALPFIHNIHMKDGFINGVRSYAGYIHSRNGALYIFSFIVNNFTGSPSAVRQKMWKLLDVMSKLLNG